MSKSFRGVTFENQSVTPSDDAVVMRHTLTDGILTGCDMTYSDDILTMDAGYLIVCGRLIHRPVVEDWVINDRTSGYARVVMAIDLSRAATVEVFDQVNVSIDYADSTSDFPALTKEDINAAGSMYQTVLAVVSLGVGGITGIQSQIGTSRVEGASYTDGVSYLPVVDGAGAHNAVYRGKDLGSAVTDAQWAAIKDGTFKDLYIGDFWTIGDVTYRIAAFDYYYMAGDTQCTHHHVTLVPDASMYAHPMNQAPSHTNGAYVGSEMYKTGLNEAKTIVSTAFGAEHVLKHRAFLSNAVSSGFVSAGSWYDSTVELMNEQNVYGCIILGNIVNGTSMPFSYSLDSTQYPLFRFRPDLISDGGWYWLRDVTTTDFFAYVHKRGSAQTATSSANAGVRPAFSIYSA